MTGRVIPQLSILMQLARVEARTERGVQLHRWAWPITAYYCLDTRYAPRVLHFSAFHIILVANSNNSYIILLFSDLIFTGILLFRDNYTLKG